MGGARRRLCASGAGLFVTVAPSRTPPRHAARGRPGEGRARPRPARESERRTFGCGWLVRGRIELICSRCAPCGRFCCFSLPPKPPQLLFHLGDARSKGPNVPRPPCVRRPPRDGRGGAGRGWGARACGWERRGACSAHGPPEIRRCRARPGPPAAARTTWSGALPARARLVAQRARAHEGRWGHCLAASTPPPSHPRRRRARPPLTLPPLVTRAPLVLAD